MSDFIYLSRDPFARSVGVRRVVVTSETCSWCGGIRTKQGKNLNSLFEYGNWSDDKSKADWLKGFFCSIECMRIYHS